MATGEHPSRQVSIETPRLLLRAAQPEDAVRLHEAFSDPEAMRYWSSPPDADLSQTKLWIRSMMESPQNGLTDFVICLKDLSSLDEPTPIGKIGIYSPLPSNEIGFLIARAHWHRGLGHEALSYMLEYLFSIKSHVAPEPGARAPATQSHPRTRTEPLTEAHTVLTLTERSSEWRYPSITADADPRNSASIGLLKKVGFAGSGYLERSMQIGGEGGEWVDSLYLKLEREAWVSRSTDERNCNKGDMPVSRFVPMSTPV
ncbi:hypothetical protein PMZ80_000379 [Knufia obscura]|uniref:N-acetyltransferase domain-containing protein n=1 Tax=Knufia obscura TaxID=1635080 RepID=A0ABR0S0P8_9EURO|nr:hypothetical protein PMZ80_000379 [Knufia obscura]